MSPRLAQRGQARRERAGTRRRLAAAALLLLACAPLLLVGGGGLRAPLWMDEVNYFVYAVDWASREAAPGRPVSLLAGLGYSLFSYSNLMAPYLAMLERVGVDLWSSPELPLRLPSFLAMLAAAGLAAYAARRQGLAVAVLAAAAFAALPLAQYYASEARVYALAATAAAAFVLLARSVAFAPTRRRLLAVAALGALLPYLSIWTAPLLVPLPLWCMLARLQGGERSTQLSARGALLPMLPGYLVALLQVVLLRTDFAYQQRLQYSQAQGASLLAKVAQGLWAAPAHVAPAPPLGLVVAGSLLFAIALVALVLALVRRRLDPWPACLAFHFVVALAVLLTIGGVVPGFVAGRYEVPVVLLAVAAAAQLPRRMASALLAGLLLVGLACTPATARRVAGKSSTRAMVERIKAAGDPRREAILARYHLGWDPLHRYTTYLYAARAQPAWRARCYPTLEPVGRDFMLFGSVVVSPVSQKLQAQRDDPAVVDWVRRERLDGVWVLSPDTEDPRPLEGWLASAGLELRNREHFAGHPESWLLHYRRAERGDAPPTLHASPGALP